MSFAGKQFHLKTYQFLVLYILFSAFILVLPGCTSTPQKTTETVPDGILGTKAKYAIARGDKAFYAGDKERALFEYVSALEFDSRNINALYKVGTLQSMNGNPLQAEKAYRQVLAIDKDHQDALEGLGLLLLHQKNYAQAKQYLSAINLVKNNRWRTNNGLGIIADSQGLYRKAQNYYQKALLANPDSPVLITNLGYSKFKAGDYSAAKSLYLQVLSKSPTFKKARSNLGLLYARQQKYDEAIEAFKKIMDKPNAYNNVGYICMIEGRYKKAQELFQEAIRLSPRYFSQAHKNLRENNQRLLKAGGKVK